MSTKTNILELLRDGTEWPISSITDALQDVSPGTVACALSEMARANQVERIRPGLYRAPSSVSRKPDRPPVRARFTPPETNSGQGETEAPEAETEGRKPETPAPAQEPHAAPEQPVEADDTADHPTPLQWALWHDGDLMLRRGEETLVLSCAEVTRLHAWLSAMQAAVLVGRVGA